MKRGAADLSDNCSSSDTGAFLFTDTLNVLANKIFIKYIRFGTILVLSQLRLIKV
jgi:hypothetical protein